jgi:predicted RNA-binding Zn ribbon-like protein
MAFATNIDVEPFFIAEHPALDLLNSICSPWGNQIDWLSDGAELIHWMHLANLITSDDAKWVSQNFSELQLNDVAKKLRTLRENFRNVVVSSAENADLQVPENDLNQLNEILSSLCQYPQIEFKNEAKSYDVTKHHRWNNPEDLLHPVAVTIADYLSSVDLPRIKHCEGPTCSLWFWDTSKNGKRRWCTMSVCGNRAKAAAHRARKKQS